MKKRGKKETLNSSAKEKTKERPNWAAKGSKRVLLRGGWNHQAADGETFFTEDSQEKGEKRHS